MSKLSPRATARTLPGYTSSTTILLLTYFISIDPSFDGDDYDKVRILGGRWEHERWWHKLTQVCQRWRNLILESSSYLGLCLVCTYGTPVADMLALSPPLPLILHYMDSDRDIKAAAEEGIMLALKQRRRVHRIHFFMPIPNLERLIKVIVKEYPVLEYLIMMSSPEVVGTTTWKLPLTFLAPHLRCLVLNDFTLPVVMTTKRLVTLYLIMDDPTRAYCPPYALFLYISFMRQLETLRIIFNFPVSDYDLERLLEFEVMCMSTMTHVTYPNLRWFEFQGASAYLEAFVHWIDAPRLEKLNIRLFKQPTYSFPRLLRFMNTAKNVRFDSAKFEFSNNQVAVGMNLREEEVHTFLMAVYCFELGSQISSLAQIFDSLSQTMFTVEHLTFKHELHDEDHDELEVDRTEWHKLFGSFSNVKTLCVDDGLVDELARCLRLNDGKHPLDVLPELQELSYTGTDDIGDTFTSFLDARKNAGRPITLNVPSRNSKPSFSESSDVMTDSSSAWSSDAWNSEAAWSSEAWSSW